MSGQTRRRLLGAVITVIGVTIIIVALSSWHTQQTGETQGGHNSPFCRAYWANTSEAVVSSDGTILLVIGKGGGATVYETTIFFLKAEGFIKNYTLSEVVNALKRENVINTIIENAGTPTVAEINVSRVQGYKILLPDSKDCVARVLPTLFPAGQSLKAYYRGYAEVPVPYEGWIYYGKPLPYWEVYKGGELVARVWVDPSKGLIVAEQRGSSIYIDVQAIVPLGGG
ncbi:MAG: hypothetical protein F7C35_07000 [Desulfurococcales archaeon]|nr:hypothetical protein [Desulfurococcales archaeon]